MELTYIVACMELHNQMLVVVLLISFVSSAHSKCSTFLKNTTHYDENEFDDCWILFRKFQEKFLEQSKNLYNLSQIFFPAFRISPLIVNVSYNVQMDIHDDYYECDYKINQTQWLGWTSKSLYNNFYGQINQIPLQVPYLVLHLLECWSGLENQPYVDDFLWAGGWRKLPEVYLTLKVNILSLNVSLYEYDNFNNLSWSLHNSSLTKCPSHETIDHALEELNQWVSCEHYIFAVIVS